MAEEANQAVVNTPVVADTTPTESTPVENKSEVADDGSFEKGFDEEETSTAPKNKVDKSDSLDSDEGEDAEDQSTDTNDESKPQGKAEERKQQLNSEIRDLVSQRNAIREEVTRLNQEVYQPATDEELLGQINPETGKFYNPLEAKFEAFKQQQEVNQYNDQVAEARLTLSSEAQRALQDFPMFDADSPDYSADIAAGVDQILGQNLVTDPNTGQVIGSRVSPYQLYKTVAEAARLSQQTGQIKGQQATEKMLASAEVSANAPHKQVKEDQFLKGFDSDF